MLNVEQLTQVLSIFGDDCGDKSFGLLSKKLREQTNFESNEHLRYKIGCTLVSLLNDKFNVDKSIDIYSKEIRNEGLFNTIQRLIALYLLFDLYSHKHLRQHPFLPFFVEIIELSLDDSKTKTDDNKDENNENTTNTDVKTEVKESKVIDSPEIVSSDKTPKIIDDDLPLRYGKIGLGYRMDKHDHLFERKRQSKYTPLSDIIEAEFSSKLLFANDEDWETMSSNDFYDKCTQKLIKDKHELYNKDNLKPVKASINTRSEFSPFKSFGLFTTLRDNDENDLDLKMGNIMNENMINDIDIDNELQFCSFNLDFMRPSPQLYWEFDQNELKWKIPMDEATFLWDNNINDDLKSNNDNNINDIIPPNIDLNKIYKISLKNKMDKNTKDKLKILIERLNLNELIKLVSVNDISLLLKYNPDIIPSIFVPIRNNAKLFNEYFEFIIKVTNDEIMIDIMGVVIPKLIEKNIIIPQGYIHQFIINCYPICKNLNDKFIQSKFVRIYGSFIKKLFKMNILKTNASIKYEIESFCMEFISYTDAASLYQFCKKRETVNNEQKTDNNTD